MKKILLLCCVFSGCSMISGGGHVELDNAVDSVKKYLRMEGNDENISCDAVYENKNYYVLCRFGIKTREWGHHSMYVLNDGFEIIEIIPGR